MAVKKKKAKKTKKRGIDQRGRAILALFVAMLSVFLLIALTSYLYTWKQDQDKVLKFSWNLLFAKEVKVDNWLGRLGAVIAHQYVFWGVGISAFLLPFYGLGTAIIIVARKHWMKLLRMTTYLTIAFLLFPLLFSFLFTQAQFSWGGAIGLSLHNYLEAFIGKVGTGVLLLFCFIGLVYWHNEYLPEIKNTFEFKWSVFRSKQKKVVDTFLSGQMFESVDPMSENDREEETEEDEFEDTITELPSIPQNNEVNAAAEEVKSLEPGIELDMSSLQVEVPKSKSKTSIADLPLEVEEVVPQPVQPQEAQPIPQVRTADVEENRKLEVEMDDKTKLLEPYDPTMELGKYVSPVLDLLDTYMVDDISINRSELEMNKNQIVTTLQHYKIEITKIRATIGPTVTLYEIVPAPGVRISKIKNLEDDIALSLAALGIRIIAPIPGKGTIGIEVPNKKKQIVSLKETMNSEKFEDAKMELPIAMGKTISNEVFIADLAKMPHLLIAGATGQGKSVGINTIIMSLLYRKHPSQVKLVLIDPKKVELFPYSKLDKHFLAFLPGQEEPIITDTKKVVHTLNSLCIEMDERYNLLKKAHARNIKEYNKKYTARNLNPLNGHKYLPFIVLVIDEFADLIMTAGKEVEMPIARLAQLARAVGIHLIIATQRPSVNIITGVIKANFPARLAFKVTSKVDSRTILDSGGADQLIGRGDMLLASGSDIIRLQCAFVDTPEVERVIDFISDQRGFAEPFLLPEYTDPDEGGGGAGSIKASELDEMFSEAAHLIVANQSGSTSMLQRKLKLGYNRAGRIMDQLEAFGVVGPNEGSKAREVYIMTESELMEHLEMVFKTN
ncbi:FtsK/SpoIIIE family DNA translocase [Membranihabitans marinus]|uniref:FtsK/SpoIIIE family DNA translocase n=1 Tax=Membranihabitans marinus TaxID=1227546 RepID=UPI001F3FB72A|nr:DNA translocase FtsK [Membranihabitans marinus]